MSQKLKGENGIVRQKFTSLQKEMDDQKEGVRKQQAEVTKLNTIIVCMEKDIIVLRRQIQEREDTIQEKVCRFFLATPSTTVHQFIRSNKKKNHELKMSTYSSIA